MQTYSKPYVSEIVTERRVLAVGTVANCNSNKTMGFPPHPTYPMYIFFHFFVVVERFPNSALLCLMCRASHNNRQPGVERHMAGDGLMGFQLVVKALLSTCVCVLVLESLGGRMRELVLFPRPTIV